MAELVDALDLGSSAARHEGSSPPTRTSERSAPMGLTSLLFEGFLRREVRVWRDFIFIASFSTRKKSIEIQVVVGI